MKINEKFFLPLIMIIGFSMSFYNFEYLITTESVSFMGNYFVNIINGMGFEFIVGSQSAPLLTLPFFILFGPTLLAIRLSQSIFLVIAIFTNYLFAKEFFNKRVALTSSVILAFLPFYILNRHAENPFNPFFSTLLLLIIYSFYKKRKKIYLVSFSLFAGFAVIAGRIFLHFLLAIFFSLLLVNIIFKKNLHKRLSKENIFTFFVLFILVLTPYVLRIMEDYPYREHLQSVMLVTPTNHNNLMVANNFGMRLLHLLSISSEQPYDESGFFKSNPIFSFLNFPLLILSIIYLLYMKKPKDYFLIFTLFLFMLFSTFVTSIMVVVHLLIVIPIIAIILGRFFEFLFDRKKMFGISLLILFLIVNSFFIIQTIMQNNYRPDLTYFYYGVKRLGNETNDIYVVNYNRSFIVEYDVFYFATIGKEIQSLCEDVVDCGIMEEVLNKTEGTKFLFDKHVIDYLDLKKKIKNMEDEGVIGLYFDIRNRHDDVIAYVYSKN